MICNLPARLGPGKGLVMERSIMKIIPIGFCNSGSLGNRAGCINCQNMYPPQYSPNWMASHLWGARLKNSSLICGVLYQIMRCRSTFLALRVAGTKVLHSFNYVKAYPCWWRPCGRALSQLVKALGLWSFSQRMWIIHNFCVVVLRGHISAVRVRVGLSERRAPRCGLSPNLCWLLTRAAWLCGMV